MFTNDELNIIKKALFNMKGDDAAWNLLSKVHSIVEHGSKTEHALDRACLKLADLLNLYDEKECPASHIACEQSKTCQFREIGYLDEMKTKECWKQYFLGEEITKK